MGRTTTGYMIAVQDDVHDWAMYVKPADTLAEDTRLGVVETGYIGQKLNRREAEVVRGFLRDKTMAEIPPMSKYRD